MDSGHEIKLIVHNVVYGIMVSPKCIRFFIFYDDSVL